MVYYFCFIAFYRFQRIETFDVFVTNVYADCRSNSNICTLISVSQKKEVPIVKSNGHIPLNADSGCEVNFVEIIHDCIPRRVDLMFIIEKSNTKDKLYLKVN